MISAISAPTCTAWPTCTGTESMRPSIGERTFDRSASASAAASAASAAATPRLQRREVVPRRIAAVDQLLVGLVLGAPLLEERLGLFVDGRLRPSSEMMAMMSPALTLLPRLTR